jgi:hypothetical protein
LSLSFNEVTNLSGIPPIYYKWLVNLNLTLLLKGGLLNEKLSDGYDLACLLGLITEKMMLIKSTLK